MGSWRGCVHSSWPYGPIFVAHLNVLVDLFVAHYRLFARTMHPNLSSVWLNFKGSFALGWLDKQILDFLHINFHHLDSRLESDVGVSVVSYSLEDFVSSHGNDTRVAAFAIAARFSKEGIGFSWARLAISKRSAVQPFPSILQHFNTQELPHLVLVAVLATRIRHCVAVWFSNCEAIMGPQGVVKRKLTVRSLVNKVHYRYFNISLKVVKLLLVLPSWCSKFSPLRHLGKMV